MENELGAKTFIALDLETTGLDSTKHGIVQIGAFATGDTEDHFKGYFVRDTDPNFSTKGVHQVQYDSKAFECNGFTPARIDKAEIFSDTLRDFNAFLQKYTQNEGEVIIVGQNTPFDVAWLIKEFRRFGYEPSVFRRVIDNVTLGYAVYGECLGQAKLASRLGIKNNDAHDALADAMTASKIFHRLSKRIRLEMQPLSVYRSRLPFLTSALI
jgi:DNA polymerase III epsilon subunit-like protein